MTLWEGALLDDPHTTPIFDPQLRGSNQSGMRAWNERLVLSILRRHGPMSKADIARVTGLSTQTAWVIIRALEKEGLLEKGKPQRGRVGQPSVPMSLSPDGALFLGLKIGRRSSELVLMDFVGTVRARRTLTYRWPTPDSVLEFAHGAIDAVVGEVAPDLRTRIAGLGVAMPFQLWQWSARIGAPEADLAGWETLDIRTELAGAYPFPVFLENDASSACGAELIFGDAVPAGDFLYFYVGYFIGGGVVLDGQLYTGRSGNAGALGSMPVRDDDGATVQLIERASICGLEEMLEAAGRPAQSLWETPATWDVDAAILDRWIEAAGEGIADAALAAVALIDFDAVIVDGSMPAEVRRRLIEVAQARMRGHNLSGVAEPVFGGGSLGPRARTLGAAAIPLSERFLVDRTGLSMPA
jgi:predicted NBD/HSP70 family sugar kinase/biotin operon repressor